MQVDELGFVTLKPAVPAQPAPTLRDELDAAADAAPLSIASASATAQPDDDDFYCVSPTTPGPAALPPALQQQPAPAPPLQQQQQQQQQAPGALVSEAAAASALGAIRASMQAAAAADAARDQHALEARIQATSQLTKPQEALAAVGEEEEEEEEEEAEEEAEVDEAVAEKAGAAALRASPRAAEPAAAAADASPEASEAAALEAAFQDATAAALLQGAGSACALPGAAAPAPPPPVTLRAAQRALLAPAALAPFYAGIQSEAPDPALGCLGRLLAARLPPSLKRARDAVFACARRPYDGAAPLQGELMATLYQAVSGASAAAPGASWTTIGFQREGDFSTDLRGVGMLGPLQALALCERHGAVARALYQQATLALHPFPFMLQCLSLTAKTLQALRLGRLNRCLLAAAAAAAAAAGGGGAEGGAGQEEAEGEGGIVLALAHDWFAGLALDFTLAWRSDAAASITRLGHIQKAVVDRAMAAPSEVLARLASFEKKQ